MSDEGRGRVFIAAAGTQPDDPGWSLLGYTTDDGATTYHFDPARPPNPKVIDGEVVPASRVLAAEPARPVVLRCDTHPDWIDCGIDRPDCVPFQERQTGTVRDRRRLSYPRLTAAEFKSIEERS